MHSISGVDLAPFSFSCGADYNNNSRPGPVLVRVIIRRSMPGRDLAYESSESQRAEIFCSYPVRHPLDRFYVRANLGVYLTGGSLYVAMEKLHA